MFFNFFGNNLKEIHMLVRSRAGSGSRHFSDERGSFRLTVGRDVVS